MLAPRLRWSVLAAAVALGVPACATPSRTVKPTEVAPAVSVATPSSTEFAVLPSVPGQRVARHPAAESAVVTPPAAVAVKPPEPVPVSVAIAPPPPDAPLVAALKAHLDGKPDAAAEFLKALDRPNQELLAQLLPPVVALTRVGLSRAGPVDYGILAAQLETPWKVLSAKATLGITKLTFCESPSGFGQYRLLPEGHAYRRGHVAEVYAEVRNVPSLAVQHPQFGEGYLTKLNTALRLRDAAGSVVEFLDADSRMVPVLQSVGRDFSRSPVRDYYRAFRFKVPQKPGRYVLAVEFLDPEAGRTVSQSLLFEVGGS